MSKKNKHSPELGRGQYVQIFFEVWNSPAWKQMSFGARLLFIALRKRFTNNNGRVYLSHRDAMEELGITNKRPIANWFRELCHYGFVEQTQGGCLGLDGRGRAAHWRITCLPRRNGNGELIPATKEYLRWSGEVFEPHVCPSRRWTADKGSRAGGGQGEGNREWLT
jgi:hypothetical protein